MIIINDDKYKLDYFKEGLSFANFSTVLTTMGKEEDMFFRTLIDGVDYVLARGDLSLESTLKLTKIKNEGL